MDVLKLIPQLFFDLISRVVPGAAAIILVAAGADLKLGRLSTEFWDGAKAIQDSAWFMGLGFIVAAYLVGQIISPISDFIEHRVVKRLFPSYFQVLKNIVAVASEYPQQMRDALIKEMGIDSEVDPATLPSGHFKNAVFVWYDWLRVNSPDAGARAAKVRAEYRMHSQNTVALIAALVTHLIWSHTHPGGLSAVFITMTVMAGVVSLWAAARTYRTFQWTVINQFYSAKSSGGASGTAETSK